MLTLTASLAAAAQAETADPRLLVQIDTGGGRMRFAEELVEGWGGYDWTARLLNAGTLEATIADGDGAVFTPRRYTVQLANADGWVSRWRPAYWRGSPVTVQQVFRDVNSVAVRTQQYAVVGMAAEATRATLSCEDMLSPLLAHLVPTRRITSVDFPGVVGLPAEGAPIPLLYGRCYAPMLLVDASSAYGYRYLVCAGVASLSGVVVERSPDGTGQLSPVTGAYTTLTAAYSLTTRDINGLTVSEVVFSPAAQIAYLEVGRFADVTGPLGADVTPAQVLGDILTNPAALSQAGGSLVDSTTLVAAHSAAVGMGLYCDVAVVNATPLGQLLGQLAQDGLLRVLPGAPLRLSMQSSRAVVASFTPQNIIEGTFSITDVAARDTAPGRVVRYTDRAYPPVVQSWVGYQVASGAVATQDAVFLGRRTAAAAVARIGAQVSYYGGRRYSFQTGLAPLAVEPGDRVYLTHSLAGIVAQECEVIDATYETTRCGWTVRELPTVALDGGNTETNRRFDDFRAQRIPYHQGSKAVATALSFTSSHALGAAPRTMTPITVGGDAGVCAASLVSANNSTWTAYVVSSVDGDKGDNKMVWSTILAGYELSIR